MLKPQIEKQVPRLGSFANLALRQYDPTPDATAGAPEVKRMQGALFEKRLTASSCERVFGVKSSLGIS
jgi:hypothetical protein